MTQPVTSPDSTAVALQRLLDIMRALRDPEQGCPWDRKQTFDTIAPYTLEETYEVLDAIARKDFDDLRDELGDLLFQVVFYAQMGQEQGLFTFDDVCHAISDKLERRHPHVFSNTSLNVTQAAVNSEAALAGWESRKAEERAEKALYSALDDIPDALPALMKAHKIQKRCASVGFDWNTLGPVLDKVYEEIDEVMFEARQAVVDEDKLGEEIGDLLFATVNLSRHLGHKAENALQAANRKFERRFRQVEQIVTASGQTMESATLDEMEAAWQQVKKQETEM
ncbi:nucleoside triphosphate pyrophosphohydrolase [Yersinia pseudotuberculosis IP 32953]|uniref:Nucleoside triphosphate pyrophosphohydrolase n=5 Tax=Yersinia pseudotuberculosis complex TaxID=1649845 RepID=Q66EE0_YERPS|nr:MULTISPECIES: nucleoside triphosphate pyrophosphohydrolase [Yersinia pseudotuberculosis complex]CQD54317.1 nucleoside triphosphate pyrophosphohydrolase [Yersinia intermedia]ABS48751.1 MazG family protein [Yersinia pseudotuberculosis IP 31758]AIN14402.1 nucleoside triphosphate pyrophosphohydrolase [Yersinia pseudotuberculosis]AJJ02146.1 nucleoside triphosphate pyrophosphohydrolase [Yersinia pseudotuberculosis]AJJ08387.1 nucleoside triphosphate pyrophosphohydrolase [Yersinia pseudotuberculosi